MPTLYLIDGHAHFFRAYHAIRTGMTSPVTNEPTNMSYGFTSVVLKLLRDYKPDYLAVVIDKAGDRETFRSELYPEYKANREAPPEDFRPQVNRCLEVLDHLDVPVIAVDGVEADDVIATIVERLTESRPDVEIKIVSKDKDLAQLSRKTVQLLDIYKDEVVTASQVFKVEGIRPEHVADVLALMGDSVDNIPGVPGIGPKTAGQLILKYGSIDGIYEHLDEIKGKRHENLAASRELVQLSRQLVELKDDLDVTFDLDAARYQPAAIDMEPALSLFRQLGFGRPRDELRRLVEDARAGTMKKEKSSGGEPSLFDAFDDDVSSGPAEPLGVYEIVTDEAGLAAVVEAVRSAKRFAVDTETDHVSEHRANLCGVSIAVKPEAAWYIPIRSPDSSSHLDLATVIAAIGPLLADPSLEKIGHNLKYDMTVFRRHDATLAAPIFDTMIASYVIDATRSSHRLDVLALATLGLDTTPLSDVIGSGRNAKTFDQVPLDVAGPYAAEDADIALRLSEVFRGRIGEMDLDPLFGDVEIPLVFVLSEMEGHGIRVDPDELDRQRERLAIRIEELRKTIGAAAPHPFNPDSPKQLAAALFNKPGDDPPGLGIRALKRGKTGPSTDVEVLEKLAGDPDIESPMPSLIVEYRRLTKLVSTYLVALKDAIHPDTQRIHASFNQTVAATGRLSSSDPNLQNIPIRTEVGREIRRAFVAEPGHLLVAADYSQIELRLLAHLAEDPGLIDAFHEGEDIHRAVAAKVFDVAPEDVSISQRSSAKMINFGIAYGITPFGLARRLGGDVTNQEAKAIIDDYKARFARIDTFLAECIENAKRDGYVETILGRRRAIPQITSRAWSQRSLGERMAINSVVQGSAADIIKIAMIDVHKRLPAAFPGTHIALQIHDELVLEAPEDDADAVAAFLTERMEAAAELKVALIVDSAVARDWYAAK